MIFQHTIDSVLTGHKTATTRIWKDFYKVGNSETPFSERLQKHGYGAFRYVWSVKEDKNRKLYYVGQRHALQPGRGQKGIATIEIEKLSRVIIHNVIDDPAFIYREGFRNKAEFLKVWRAMHGQAHLALHIQFKLLNRD